jgi:acetyl-CoA carboxylase biotin carboxyl carrier protein
MEMEQDVMKALLEAFEQSDWQEMTVTIGGDRLHVSRQPSSNGPAPAPPTAALPAPPSPEARPTPEPQQPNSEPDHESTSERAPAPTAQPAATAQAPPEGTTVTSPSVGLFWRAPSPGAPPFVEVGGHVGSGDTVAIVEVMKLMNHVTAPVSGTVVAVLADNGEAVEFGQVLVVIDPEA